MNAIRGYLPLIELSWYWVSGKAFLEDWEKVLLSEYNQYKTFEVLTDIVEHINQLLEVPFPLVDDDRYGYKLLDYIHRELDAMIAPPEEPTHSSMGYLTTTTNYNQLHQCCVSVVVSILCKLVGSLSKISSLSLSAIFEEGYVQWVAHLQK